MIVEQQMNVWGVAYTGSITASSVAVMQVEIWMAAGGGVGGGVGVGCVVGWGAG